MKPLATHYQVCLRTADGDLRSIPGEGDYPTSQATAERLRAVYAANHPSNTYVVVTPDSPDFILGEDAPYRRNAPRSPK